MSREAVWYRGPQVKGDPHQAYAAVWLEKIHPAWYHSVGENQKDIDEKLDT